MLTTNAPKVIACAAIKNIKTGLIICGVRHGDCLNFAMGTGIDPCPGKAWECGFCDQDRNFLSRKEAWKVADAAGQIRRPTGFERDFNSQRTPNIGDEGMLFSENLY